MDSMQNRILLPESIVWSGPKCRESGCNGEEPTCVVGRVVVGVQELLDKQGSGDEGMLGNGVQVALQAPLPLCYELSVHVADQLLGRQRQADSTYLETRTHSDQHKQRQTEPDGPAGFWGWTPRICWVRPGWRSNVPEQETRRRKRSQLPVILTERRGKSCRGSDPVFHPIFSLVLLQRSTDSGLAL